MELGYFERSALIEKLAKKFLAIQGYVVSDSYNMQESNNPRAKMCVLMAFFAVEEFESTTEVEQETLDDNYPNVDNL